MISNEVINKSIDYIIENINNDISVSDVANYCNYSKYYFCRAFKEATGYSVYAFIKRLKMDYSAAKLLMDKNKSITDIGLQYGYSPSNYSTAFKKYHNKSPVEFRNANNSTEPLFNNILKKQLQFKSFEEYDKNIEIQEMDDFLVLYERYFGSYMEIKKSWLKFLSKYKRYFKENTIMLTKTYDNPCVTNLDQCMYDICITVDKECQLDNVTVIKGGKYAVYHYEGMSEDILLTYHGLIHVWLDKKGFMMDRGYFLNICKNKIDMSKHAKMDLCIPIK